MYSGALRFLRLRNFWKKTPFRKLYVWLKNCLVLSCFKMPFAGLNIFLHVICANCLLLSYKQVTKWYFLCNLELLSNRTFFKDYLSWGVVHFSFKKMTRIPFFPNSPQNHWITGLQKVKETNWNSFYCKNVEVFLKTLILREPLLSVIDTSNKIQYNSTTKVSIAIALINLLLSESTSLQI